MVFDAIKWLHDSFIIQDSDSSSMTYGGQRSMSYETFPGIYIPFDPRRLMHSRIRGNVIDFGEVFTGKNVLDFGCGDGFPSLLVAPYVANIIGIDASASRINECNRNALRLGTNNAKYIRVSSGMGLPFKSEQFSGALASWSLEQTPDAIAVAKEIFRVLCKGSCFRFEPEPLWIYKNGLHQSVWLPSFVGDNCTITFVDRNLREECCQYYGLALNPHSMELAISQIRTKHGQSFKLSCLSREDLELLKPYIIKVGAWKTRHPSLTSWVRHLTQIGFSSVRVTRSGGWYANHLYSFYTKSSGPKTIEELDEILTPFAKNAHLEDVPADREELCLFIHAIK